MNAGCGVCGKFREKKLHIENRVGHQPEHLFPEEFEKLTVYRKGVGTDNNESILQCPECGQYFLYKIWIQTGEDDLKMNWVNEWLSAIPDASAQEMAANADIHPSANEMKHCPKCGSFKVCLSGGGYVGGQAFVKMQCKNCGHEAFVDEFQLGEWCS